jgi:hypothetical protein
MTRFHDAWLTHQRNRFMRPDAGRYLRADAFRWQPPGSVDLAEVVLKFDPDQPRVPAGSPDGGQWTESDAGDGEGAAEGVVEEIVSGAAELAKVEIAKLFDLVLGNPGETELSPQPLSDDAELILAASRGPRHHWVARQVFQSYPFSKETLNVFENAVTAPLNDPTSNYYDQMHRQYNKGVDDALKRFMDRNNIRADEMTPAQARQFIREVKSSTDPRIFDFNKRLLIREFNFLMRRVPRGEI